MCYHMLYMSLWSITHNPSLLLVEDEYMYLYVKLVNDINFKNWIFGTFENHHIKLFPQINNMTDQKYI